jgi:predicted amidohydrolase YtcJ
MWMMFGFDNLEIFQAAGMKFSYGDDRLRLGAVKFILTESTGQLQPEPAELNRRTLLAHRAGFPLAFHAVEPATVAAAIGAIENAQRELPDPHRRHRIEHCSECPPELLARLAGLPVTVASQPPFLYYSGERYIATVPPERFPWLYRFRSLLEQGLVVAGSSDSPLVPADPIIGMYAAITRKADTGQTVIPEEAVTPEQALAMYTINAAYVSGEEQIKGSITPGKLADMAVLSGDPLRLSPDEIKDIQTELTIIDGQVVWEK